MYTFVPPPPMECVATVQPAGIPFWVMWPLGKDTSCVPNGFQYPKGGQLEMDGDLEGQSKGVTV